jgi:hypothetical protein
MNCFFRWTEVQLPLLKQRAPTKLYVERLLGSELKHSYSSPILLAPIYDMTGVVP